MFEIEACDREKNEAAMEWVPFGNRSAEAEYFFDGRNEEVRHYEQTLLRLVINNFI